METLWLQLGVAGIVGMILWVLLKQATDERKQITRDFLAALTGTVKDSNDARVRTANELAALQIAIRDHQEKSADEHQRIVDAIGRLGTERRRG